MSSLNKLASQLQQELVPLTVLEEVAIGIIRQFPHSERLKLFDLLSRFAMAQKHTGEMKLSFAWLLEEEGNYDAEIDSSNDPLQEVRLE